MSWVNIKDKLPREIQTVFIHARLCTGNDNFYCSGYLDDGEWYISALCPGSKSPVYYRFDNNIGEVLEWKLIQ